MKCSKEYHFFKQNLEITLPKFVAWKSWCLNTHFIPHNRDLTWLNRMVKQIEIYFNQAQCLKG